MTRALALLKYLPAVLCGLLVVAWVVSLFLRIGIVHEFGSGKSVIAADSGSVSYRKAQPMQSSAYFYARTVGLEACSPTSSRCFGNFGSRNWIRSKYSVVIWKELSLPIPFFLMLLSPIAVGCLTRFRFPLWSYFAWTALVAAELAYYLR